MLREYEFTLISNAQLSEADSKNLHEKYEQLMLESGGQIIKKSDWGTKKLAFPIKKHFRGKYTFYDLKAEHASLAEAERLMRIDDNILRYLSVKIGGDVDVDERKAQIAKEEAAAAKTREPEDKKKI